MPAPSPAQRKAVAEETDYEPLSVADRIELGRIQPWGNSSYLASRMGSTVTPVAWHKSMAPSTFSCPICKGTVTAVSHPEVIGSITLGCNGTCDAASLDECCRADVSPAFRWRDDLFVPMPPEAVAALIAGAMEGRFTPGLKVPLSKIAKLRAGADHVRAHIVQAPDGSTIFLVLRFEYSAKSKVFCQFHCAWNPHGALEIEIGLPSGPWPLVGLAELTARPDDPVLILEGESAREAAMQKLPDFVACTSMCGADNAHMTDWSPLRGRDVTIMPDNDEPGAQYARTVAAQAFAEGAASVRIVPLPAGDLPTGWDIADPLAPGISLDDVNSWISCAPPTSWAAVRHAYRSPSRCHHVPPFRLPDGHLAKVRSVVEGLPAALELVDSSCSRQKWKRVLGGIFHAVGYDVGLPIAREWSRGGPVEHDKFDEQEWPGVFDAIAASPPVSPMSLKAILWEAIQQSKDRAERTDRGNSEPWHPDEVLMAEANLAAFESRHRAVLRGDGLEVATQKRLEDGTYVVEIRSQKAAEALYRSKRTQDHSGKTVKVLCPSSEHLAQLVA